MLQTRRRIGELMVEDGVITDRQLREALALQEGQGGRVADRLITLGYLTAHSFCNFLARQPGVSSIVLSNYQVRHELLLLVPRAYAESRQVFPIDRLGKLLTVGMACPLDRATIEELEEMTALRVKPMLCSRSNIKSAITRYYGFHSDHDGSALRLKERYRLQWVR